MIENSFFVEFQEEQMRNEYLERFGQVFRVSLADRKCIPTLRMTGYW